ncbi:phosphoglucomutase [Porphyromonas macacae]|uniref:Phosphoglucomutase n=2 Tax=Porphyromonas macacae TaxID=28115 RepID=A0A379E6D8_9PORP|nr:phospho-sugar mutase [Porphyromonas macacae]KGN98596.1 phosphoglucomutase [Porphyromonas macacae]SUB88283.1 Phosphoglucomutase [Porphyromonas macacae]
MNEKEELMTQVRAKAMEWLSPQYDEETRNAVQAMLDSADPTELIDSFYKDLEFGTGGLRGIMGAGSNRMNRYTVGAATQGLSNYLKREFADLEQIKVVIGYDCRNNSPHFADIVAHIFAANGIKVYIFDKLRPTPEISFAIRALGCQSGVMITASHNPKIYNGYKAYWSDGAQMIAPHDRNTIIEVNKIRNVQDIKFEGNDELIEVIGEEMDKQFIEAVKSLSLSPEAVKNQRGMKIVYTPIHGTGVEMVPRALRAFGFENIINVPEQDVVSGNFPTVDSPNPENPEAMALAVEKAKETGAELVLASDPDGDRLGVGLRNNEGEITLINGNEICTLMTYYSIMRRKELGDLRENDYVVKTIVTTELIREIANRNEVTLYDCYTGFKWIADVIRQNEGKKRYIGGGEESYGFLWEDFIRDKSSVSACCMFAEMNAWALDKGISLYQMLQNIYLEYGFFAEKGISVVRTGKSGADEIEAMMKGYRNEPMTEIAGSKVKERLDYARLEGYVSDTGDVFTLDMPTTSNVLQFMTEDGTKLSIRPSGTEPKIKYYIGVRQPVSGREDLAEAEKICAGKIARIRQELNI